MKIGMHLSLLPLMALSSALAFAQTNENVDQMFERAKEEGAFHRLLDIDDPKEGFAFRRINQATGILEVVFVSCGRDLQIVEEHEIEEDTGKCNNSAPSSLQLTFAAASDRWGIGNQAMAYIDGEKSELVEVTDFYFGSAGQVIGYQLMTAGQTMESGSIVYLDASDSQIIASGEMGREMFGFLPLTNNALYDTEPVAWAAGTKVPTSQVAAHSPDEMLGVVPIVESIEGVPVASVFKF